MWVVYVKGMECSCYQDGDGVVIVDAGGGTIDVSSYSRDPNSPKESFEEIAAPQCPLLFITFEIARIRLLHTRSLPRFCFCYHSCKTVLAEYVVTKLSISLVDLLPRSLGRVTLSRRFGAYCASFR